MATRKEEKLRDERRISKVYGYLMSMNATQLTTEHKDKLLESRGLVGEDAERLGYRSMPSRGRRQIVEACEQEFGEGGLAGVPGFWEQNNKKISRLGWDLAGSTGMMIPVRNIDGDICGIKIRTKSYRTGYGSPSELLAWQDGYDRGESRKVPSKYVQLSSNPAKNKDFGGYNNGTAAKTSVHYPIIMERPKLGEPMEVLRITEGEIKADITTMLSGVYTISIPGIGMWAKAIESVKLLKPKKILLAFDSDKEKKVSSSTSDEAEPKPFGVGIALANLYKALRELEYDVKIEHWENEDGDCKGIDDVYHQGLEDTIAAWSDDDSAEFSEEMLKGTYPPGWFWASNIQLMMPYGKNAARTPKSLWSWQSHYCAIEPYNQIKIGVGQYALHHPSFLKFDNPTYAPGQGLTVIQGEERLGNTWAPSKLEPVFEGEEEAIETFTNHCKYIIGLDEECEIFYDFLAHNVQFPGRKIRWAVVLQGVQGTGKSYFGQLMGVCLGEHNMSRPTNEGMHEKFTDWQKDCCMIVVEELNAGSNSKIDLMNMLKPKITETMTTVRPFGKASYQQPNTFNFMLLTNHEDAIIIDDTDRRHCIFLSKAVPKDAEYYNDLFDLTPEKAGRILGWLQSRDLSNFNPNAHAPDTVGKREMLGNNGTNLTRVIRERIQDHVWPFHLDIVSVADLMARMDKSLYPTPINLGHALKAAGARGAKSIKLSEHGGLGKRARLYSVRRHEMWWGSADGKVEGAKDELWRDTYEALPKERDPQHERSIQDKPM